MQLCVSAFLLFAEQACVFAPFLGSAEPGCFKEVLPAGHETVPFEWGDYEGIRKILPYFDDLVLCPFSMRVSAFFHRRLVLWQYATRGVVHVSAEAGCSQLYWRTRYMGIDVCSPILGKRRGGELFGADAFFAAVFPA